MHPHYQDKNPLLKAKEDEWQARIRATRTSCILPSDHYPPHTKARIMENVFIKKGWVSSRFLKSPVFLFPLLLIKPSGLFREISWRQTAGTDLRQDPQTGSGHPAKSDKQPAEGPAGRTSWCPDVTAWEIYPQARPFCQTTAGPPVQRAGTTARSEEGADGSRGQRVLELCLWLNPRGGCAEWVGAFVHTRGPLVLNAYVAACSQKGNQLYPRRPLVWLSLIKALMIKLPQSGC